MADRGRPRTFDPDEALRQAMKLFWERGYEGTTLSDLTAAMGINRPSLYAAFGSKEALFRRAVELYDDAESKALLAALNDQRSARDAIEAFLRANAEAYTDPRKPSGCMIVLAAMIGTPENRAVRDHLTSLRRATEETLCHRLRQAVTTGELPATTDCNRIAAFYTTVLHGLSLQARDGASNVQLAAVIDAAMTGWDALIASSTGNG